MNKFNCLNCDRELDESNTTDRKVTTDVGYECPYCGYEDNVNVCSKCGTYHYGSNILCEVCAKKQQDKKL